MKFINRYSFILIACCLSFTISNSQDLEPRAINNLPVGSNFLIAIYSYSQGNILMDPSLQIEGLNSKMHTTAIAYLRSINFFGLSGKVDVILPYAVGDWEGSVDDSFERVSRNGLGDMRLRLSFNYLGSPALKGEEFLDYKPDLISGISFQAIVPTGNYNPSELLNFGSNRWAFKTQWGIAKNFEKWVVEFYANIWLFTKNNNFLQGNEMKQNPLFTVKTHLIRKLPKNRWISANLGYAIGGKTYVNGIERDTKISTARLGLFYAIPVNINNTLKFGYISGVRFKKGSDFDAISIAYQYGWNNSLKRVINNK